VRQNNPISVRHRREGGVALLVTSLVLLLVGMLAIASLQDAEQESTAGARSRATARTLYAADAGIQLALGRLIQSPPNLNAFDLDLADGANIQSRARTETLPAPITQVSLGEAEEGYALNIGAGASSVSRVYQVNVTSSYANAAAAELEARLNRTEVIATGY